jgi:DNA-repair protein XRCC1
MPEVKFDQIVSFSSEDSSQKADNLLANKKWRCQNAGESQATVVIQLSKTAQISSIDIGNNGSAFIEVQVGRKASNEDFKVILVASSFLTPIESRNETNLARVRMFTSEKLNGDIAKDKWDQIKVICSQPFNKSTKYGLSFITVHAIGEDKKKVNTNNSTALGAFRLKDEDDDTIGSLFTGRNSLKKEKESVATSLRSEATLASMAVCTEEASRKRKALDESRQFYQLKKPAAENEASSAKKQKISTTPNVQSEKKLPRRDIIAPGESPLAATSTTPKATPKEKKIRIKESTPVASSSPALASKIKKLPQKKSKPFNELMENVHFCISGFQNPLRGDIRQKALEMGARYKGDWDSSSTHLICAFVNTPKFNQVKAGKGKIVKKDWIERCFEDKKLYPWRRFCLDKNDKGN